MRLKPTLVDSPPMNIAVYGPPRVFSSSFSFFYFSRHHMSSPLASGSVRERDGGGQTSTAIHHTWVLSQVGRAICSVCAFMYVEVVFPKCPLHMMCVCFG